MSGTKIHSACITMDFWDVACMRKSSSCLWNQNVVPTIMFESDCMYACVCITLLCSLNVSECCCLCVCIATSNVAVYSIHRGLYSLAVQFSMIVEIHQYYEHIHGAKWVCWVYVHVDHIVLPCCICLLILLVDDSNIYIYMMR